MSHPIPVRAKVLGYYDGARRRPGAEFTVRSESEVGSWMERLDEGPEKAPPKAKKDK